MTRWDDTPPSMRLEAHYADRVMRCFADRPASLHDMLEDAAQRYPQSEALVCGSQRLSYAELIEQAAWIAAGLQSIGIRQGDRVAMLLGNRIEFVLVLFAAARLGAIAVPLSVREQGPGIAFMLNQCQASVVVHEDELSDRLPTLQAAPALRTRVAVGAATGSLSLTDWMQPRPAPPVARVSQEDTAVLLYTSGTTGRPKGAMLTHLGIVHSSMHYRVAMGLGPTDSTVAAVPLSHVTGLVALITTFVHCAGKLVIMPAFKAGLFLDLAVRERITHTLMVPAMYNLCLIQPGFGTQDLSAWRVGAYGGAPMPVASIEALARTVPSLTLLNCYGSTETTSPSTLMPQGATATHGHTVGRALPCVDMCVMDDDGREVPPDTLGEIWIRGPMVVPGYWDNPEATKANFTAGYWRSGDLGAIDAQGFVRVVDRKKDMINRGGYKIYTIEVENALYEHPAVLECAVVARSCPVLGERVHAYVSLADPVVDAEMLRQHCLPRLSDYKVPESFTLQSTPLPRNANGKLLKREMRAALVAAAAALRPQETT
ncbi:MAG: class I adenylate-forming enzyme family protein [Rubrivivax sp.]